MNDTKTDITYRSLCPIARSLDLLGDKWTLLIMRDALFFDCKTYADYSNSIEKIPTNLLADRLKKLVKHELLKKVPYQEKPIRYEYLPTKKGKEIKSILRSMLAFGENHLEGKAH